MDQQAEFIQILSNLSSSDNPIRLSAEERYQSLQREGGDVLALLLLNTLSSSSISPPIPDYIRKLSVILLRRLLIEQEESLYHHLSSQGYSLISS